MVEKNFEGESTKTDCQDFVIPDDLEQELQYVNARFVDGFSSDEFAQSRRVSLHWARCMIKRMVQAGVLEYAGRRTGTRIDGVRCMIPVYRVVRNGRTDSA